jgi:histidinol dehydrogenase
MAQHSPAHDTPSPDPSRKREVSGPLRLDANHPDFPTAFAALVNARREADGDVSRDVAAIIRRVRSEGDAAVADLTQKFDGHTLPWSIPLAECHAALDGLAPDLRAALELAATRIRAYHDKQKPADSDAVDDTGTRIGARWRGVDAAGVYVPGGRAAYPSSVLMNLIPAKVAGVERLVMVTPTPGGEANRLVLAAAALAGADEVWRIGGAQAVAALAYGTETIRPVDVVTGPGNAWVAEAKRQVYGVVGIDMVAGPSEIVVVADATNDPDWIAADLLSQAEHDPTSQSILFTDDADFADRVAAAVEAQLQRLTTEATARASWEANGTIILVASLADAIPLCDRLAPEHLELAVADPEPLFALVRHAGSVFLGRHTPEAVGDYVGGPNHVLPTGRRARFSSGLSVLDFMKRTSFLGCTAESIREIGPAAVMLAEAEGLPAHAASVAVRLNQGN